MDVVAGSVLAGGVTGATSGVVPPHVSRWSPGDQLSA
jgi:hypothetical protein